MTERVLMRKRYKGGKKKKGAKKIYIASLRERLVKEILYRAEHSFLYVRDS